MYLLDTNVVSELRKATAADPRVVAWSARSDAAGHWLSAMTVMELEIGILRVERRDGEQARRLRVWFEDVVLPRFHGRVLLVDTAIARRCARLHVPDPRPERDALIAATALVHGLTVVTRNAGDFEPMGVSVFNPWGGV